MSRRSISKASRGGLLLVIVWVAALIGPSVSPVSACTATRLIGEDEVPPDTVVFLGTAVKVVDPRPPFVLTWSSADMMEWTFAVDHVVSGPAQDRIVVRSERMDASCGYEFELGHRYRVIATDRGNGLETVFGGPREIEPLADPPAVEGEQRSPVSSLVIAGAVVGIGVMAVRAFKDRRRRGGSDA